MNTSTKQSVIETLADLVRIPSVNPNYSDGTGELAVAQYVESFFADRGIDTMRQSVLEDRPNIIAMIPGGSASGGSAPGSSSPRRVILEAHMDTVSTAGMTIDPFSGAIRDGKLYGRGACDTKAGLAAMMHAVADLVHRGLRPKREVWLAATVDEEYSYRGVAKLCQGDLRADAAMIAEPTELRSVIASKGLVRWKIETVGRAAHSAKPHLGVNAIEHMARIIIAIEEDTRRLQDHRHPLLGPATCNIGVIRGGVQINFVPDRCEIEIDRRLLPGETVDGVLSHYQSIVDAVAQCTTDMQVTMQPPMLTDVPLQTDPQTDAVQTIVQILEQCGLPSEVCGVPFCSDASKFGAKGIPSLIMGPGSIDQAHAAIEYVDCEQVERAVEIYRRFLLEF
jgi:acetylornithine deacetylase